MTERPLEGMRVCCSLISSFPFNNARAIKIAESLTDAGADVTVLFDSPGEPQLPEGRFRAVRVEWEQITPSTSRFRLVRAVHDRVVLPPMRWLLENLRRYGLDRRLLAAMMHEDADVYHAYFLNATTTAYVASRLRGARLIYDMRDIFVDSRKASLTKRQQSFYKWAHRRMARRADLVLAVSEPMAAEISAVEKRSRVEVIYNGPWECTPIPSPVHDPVRLLFQGFFAENRNLRSLVKAMPHLRGRAELTLQGWGDEAATLQQLAEELGLTDTVHVIAECTPHETVNSAREHDVGVISYRGETRNLEVTAPNKLLDYIGAGLAIAGSDLPGIRSLVEGSGIGVLLDPATPETIAEGLDRIISDRAELASMKTAASRACRGLCWERQAEKLVALYSSMPRRQRRAVERSPRRGVA